MNHFFQFNEDASLLTIACKNQYKIIQTSPFKTLRIVTLDQIISKIAVKQQTPILALQLNNDHQILFVNDETAEVIAEISFTEKIIRFQFIQQFFVIQLQKSIEIYEIPTLALIYKVQAENQCFAVYQDQNMLELAFSQKQGQISFTKINCAKFEIKTVVNQISQSHISSISISDEFVFTGSEAGKTVNLLEKGQLQVVQVLRRGENKSKIVNLSFDGNFLAVSSEHGTVHIFDIQNAKNQSKANKIFRQEQRAISMIKDIENEVFHIVRFHLNGDLLLATTDGLGFYQIGSEGSIKKIGKYKLK